MSVYEILKKQAETRSFSDDELRSMSSDHRRYIATANRDAIKKPAGIEAVLNGRKITQLDKEAATAMMFGAQIKDTLHYRPENTIKVQGGSMYYTPAKVCRQTLLGKEEYRANAPIPVGFGQKENYPNVQAVAAVAAQVVRVNEAHWESAVNTNAWVKLLPVGPGMDGLAISKLGDMFAQILNTCATWKAMDTIQRNSTTGMEALMFIRQELDKLPPEAYDIINTRMVLDFLKPFEKDGAEWFERVDEEENPVIPGTAYKKVKDASSETKSQVKREGYPGTYHYHGGYAPALNMTASVGSWKSTFEAYNKMVELQGGNGSSTAILAGMTDYSGLTDDYGKRIQFTLATTLWCWAKGLPVDIALYSVGDIVMLKSSFNKWTKYLEDLKSDHVDKWARTKVTGNVKFILPGVGDLSKIDDILKPECIYVPRPGSVIIYHTALGLPTASTKKQVVDYYSRSTEIIPSNWKDNEVIAYAPIYSDYYFDVESTDDDRLTAQASKARPAREYRVYKFGISSYFRGVITTLQDFGMIGWGYQKVQNKKVQEIGEPKLVLMQYQKVAKFSVWMDLVHADCLRQMVAWLRPISRYSPISNLPYMSKKGVLMILAAAESEDGVLIPNMKYVEGTSKARGRRIQEDDEIKSPKTTDQPKSKKKAVVAEDDDEEPEPLVQTRKPVPQSDDDSQGGDGEDEIEPEAPPETANDADNL